SPTGPSTAPSRPRPSRGPTATSTGSPAPPATCAASWGCSGACNNRGRRANPPPTISLGDRPGGDAPGRAAIRPRRRAAMGRSFPLDRLAEVELQVALVAPGMDAVPVDRLLDGAPRFVGVRAVGELAEGDVGAELDEEALDLGGLDAPELELAEPRGV